MKIVKVAAGVVLSLVAAGAAAQQYPSKPIRLMVPFPPGGSTDIVAHVVAPSVYQKLEYDPIKDFAPVSLMAVTPYLLVVNPGVPANNVKELVELMKSQPGKLNYASAGVGSTTHLAMEMLKGASDTYALHIPYNGNGPAGTAGRVRALAVGTPKRSPSLPEVPTVAESGYPGFDASLWLAIMAPAGTPAPVIERLNKEIIAAVSSKDTAETLDKNGAEPLTSTPAELAAMIREGVVKYAKVVKDAGVKPE